MSSAIAVPIEVALAEHELLGAALGDIDTFGTWVAALKAAFGEELNREERRAYDAISGSRQPPAKRVRELWAVVGRRGGKSRMAAAIAVYLATLVNHAGKLAPGELGYIMVLSSTIGQAKTVFGYALAFLEASPILRQLLDGEPTADEIRLKGGIVIATHTNSFRSVRGRTLLGCIYDETAFWRDDAGANPDVEVHRAIVPALLTTKGMLVAISSAYRKVGLLYSRHRDYFGKDDDRILVIQGGTTTFNPTIDADDIDQALRDDPTGARAEYDAEFRTDVAALLDDATIEAAIDHGRPLELAPRKGVSYVAFADASAGRHDAFTFCIGHREGEKDASRFVVDVIRGRRPPFDPKTVAAEYAALAREYGCDKVIGDAYAGEWVSSAFRDAGIAYTKSELPKSGLYLEGLPHFMRGVVSMPELPILVRELRLLERRTHRSGKDSVDHGRNGSDDHANVLFGALWLAVGKKPRTPITAIQGRQGTDADGVSWNGAFYSLRPGMPTERPNITGGHYERFDCWTGEWVDMRTLRDCAD
jgi:hypothetical protein